MSKIDTRFGSVSNLSARRLSSALLGQDTATFGMAGLAWAAAIAFMVLAASAFSQGRSTADTVVFDAVRATSLPEVAAIPLDHLRAKTIADEVNELFPNLRAVVEQSGIRLHGNNTFAVRDFVAASHYLTGRHADVRWHLDKVCIGTECPAVVSGTFRGETVVIRPPSSQ